jgi:hypothetical protein
MKKTRLRADTKTNTYLLICKKVAKALEKEIEKITAKTQVPHAAFNSVISRMEVRKHLRAMRLDVEWREDMTVQELTNLLWPKKVK